MITARFRNCLESFWKPLKPKQIEAIVGIPQVSSTSEEPSASEKRKDEGLFYTSKKNLFVIHITLDGPSIGLLVLALAMRLYRLEFPRSVVYVNSRFHYSSLVHCSALRSVSSYRNNITVTQLQI